MSHRGGSSAGYGFNSGPNPYGGASSHEEPGAGILDQLRPYTSKVEDFLENASEPIKP